MPIKMGELGVYSAKDAARFAFVASRVQSLKLQSYILRDCDIPPLGKPFTEASLALQETLPGVDLSSLSNVDTVPPKPMHYLAGIYFGEVSKRLATDYVLTDRQQAVIGSIGAQHAQDFLMAIPIEGLGQRMTPPEYRAVLSYRLMIPLFVDGDVCPKCKVKMDPYGDHAIHCQKQPGFKYRHDLVRDVLYDTLVRAGIPATKEAPVNFLTPPGENRSTLRPADVLIYSWDRGKRVCVDLTGVSPLVGFGSGVFVVGQAAAKAAEAKVAKHEKACTENQHGFSPFAFDTFGFLASEAVVLLRRIQKFVNRNLATASSAEYVFRRVGFAIQKGVAVQLVARLPT
jgi:hypothetical protein